MLQWNFDVKRVDVILEYDVEYRGLMLVLPILVLQCGRGGQPALQLPRRLYFHFWGGWSWWNWLKIFWEKSLLQASYFQGESLPRPNVAGHEHAKPISSGEDVARLCEFTKGVSRWRFNIKNMHQCWWSGRQCQFGEQHCSINLFATVAAMIVNEAQQSSQVRTSLNTCHGSGQVSTGPRSYGG